MRRIQIRPVCIGLLVQCVFRRAAQVRPIFSVNHLRCALEEARLLRENSQTEDELLAGGGVDHKARHRVTDGGR